MNKKNIIRTVAVTVGALMTFGSLGFSTGCSKKTNENLVVMTEALNGLFNPFYSTSSTDMDVVGMTQISMLSTDSNGDVAYGKDEATVVLDYKSEYDQTTNITTYYFVLKNGITFSDGEPLTMNDVLFNMYVYLDPVYTGSSTMYSTDIVGLSSYRNQKSSSSGSSSTEDAVTSQANSAAQLRVNELINLFHTTGKTSSSSTTYEATEADMREAIGKYTTFSTDYKNAVSATTLSTEEYQAQLLEDYEFTLQTFREELESDYESAKDSYTEDPYKSTGKFDEIVSFMYMEGFVDLKYAQSAGGVVDKSKITEVTANYNTTTVKDKESAINYVYNSKVTSALDEILSYYSTAITVKTDYISKATEVILHKDLPEGQLAYPNISGIVSMGHSTNDAKISINGTVYNIASAHNEDGTVKNDGEYDVLRVKINGVDPKAIWNFGFTVAPYHYYSDTTKYKVDIKNNQFGVEWGSYDFMKNVIQGEYNGIKKNQLPIGAGPYAATNASGSENPTGASFYDNNVVYFRANEDFLLGAPKIKYVQYQVMSSTNALDNLASGSVHFVSPQYTKANMATIKSLSSKGISSVSTWQLGYGYIGINAGKVTDINLRKAIMSAMDVSLSLSYYETGTATTISWPMSVVSWAYPRATGTTFDASNPTANTDNNNGHDYMTYTNESKAIDKIKKYMAAAGKSAGDPSLTIKFTIAGSNLTEHPAYSVFEKAATLLNQCGWDITVVPDTNALTKLSTGSLAVWAAAWGSTIDPDMYQVYHKNSTASSVLAWGYREILANPASYKEENTILTKLSTLIDNGRKTTDQTTRAGIYKEAMGYVLDLAVEMPVYQRQTLYAYNANVIDTTTFPESINSYSSPLGRIWEIDLVR